MKKIILTSFLTLTLLASINAQQTNEKKITFGVKTGINFSSFTNNALADRAATFPNTNEFESFFRISALAGVSATYLVNDKVCLHGELLYNTRGMAYRQENNSIIMIGDNGNEQAYDIFKFNVDYVELPLFVSYSFTTPEKLFNGYLGVAPAIAVVKETKMDYEEVTAGPGQGKADQTTSLKNVNSFK